MCRHKTMQTAMKLCPEYLKYIKDKSKSHGDYYSILKAYLDMQEKGDTL
jgi:hypothetical protein